MKRLALGSFLLFTGCSLLIGRSLDDFCGDGQITRGEDCDTEDPGTEEGCPPTSCNRNLCGNGVLDAEVGEACDPADPATQQKCSALCQTNAGSCGDGLLDFGEECDDGNTNSGDNCSALCQLETPCGNGVLDPEEDCDNVPNEIGDRCNTSCEFDGCDALLLTVVSSKNVDDIPFDNRSLFDGCNGTPDPNPDTSFLIQLKDATVLTFQVILTFSEAPLSPPNVYIVEDVTCSNKEGTCAGLSITGSETIVTYEITSPPNTFILVLDGQGLNTEDLTMQLKEF